MNTKRSTVRWCAVGAALAAGLAMAGIAGAGSVTIAVDPTELVVVGSSPGAFSVRNPTGSPISLQAELGNYSITPNGHVVVNPRHAPQHSAKRWLSIEPKSFTIQPHTNATLIVHPHPAKDASPGDHHALVLFSTVPSGKGPVLVRTRIAVSVLVRIQGNIKRRLVIGGLSVARRSHVLRLVVKNRGNINERLLRRHVSVALRRGGRIVQRLSSPARDILPYGRSVFRLPYRQGLTGKVTAIVTVLPLNGAAAGSFAPPERPRKRKFHVRL